MKIVNTGEVYRFYGDDLKIYDRLPAQVYNVGFHKMMGFSLEEGTALEIKEKVYGVHMNKVFKVLNGFKLVDRNFGVILSGDKGIGKSLCAKMIAIEGIKRGYPVILVKKYFNGLADFLDQIEQEAIIIFDEFDKTYLDNTSETEDRTAPQDELLSLLDGMNCGKKLFVITCNSLYKLSDYLINRPGRFHYHLRFEYPTDMEIREYLQDKIPQEYWSEINAVVDFSHRVNLNYDCLRAIAFELCTGESFVNAIQDLNIINIGRRTYNLELVFENGETVKTRGNLDLFDPEGESVYFRDRRGHNFEVEFRGTDAQFDYLLNCEKINGDNITIDYNYDSDEHWLANKGRVLYLTIRGDHAQDVHYAF